MIVHSAVEAAVVARGVEAPDRVVVASGFFDPVHVGHVAYLREAAKLGEALFVIVNDDSALEKKRGREHSWFMPISERLRIIDSIKGVDVVIPWPEDTVDLALECIMPAMFAKGGDRTDSMSIPEWATCYRCGIQVITGVGGAKSVSSSELLMRWVLLNANSVA